MNNLNNYILRSTTNPEREEKETYKEKTRDSGSGSTVMRNPKVFLSQERKMKGTKKILAVEREFFCSGEIFGKGKKYDNGR